MYPERLVFLLCVYVCVFVFWFAGGYRCRSRDCAAEEENIQEVHFPGSRPRCTPWYEFRWARRTLPCPCSSQVCAIITLAGIFLSSSNEFRFCNLCRIAHCWRRSYCTNLSLSAEKSYGIKRKVHKWEGLPIWSAWFFAFIFLYFGNRFQRGLKRKPMALIKKLRKAVSALLYHQIWSLISLPSKVELDLCKCRVQNLTGSLDYRLYILSTFLQKREAPAGEKPEPVRTHLRNMIIVPEMIGSVIGVYNGKTFNQVEIKVCPLRFLAWYIFSFFLKLWLQDWKYYYTWHIHPTCHRWNWFLGVFMLLAEI